MNRDPRLQFGQIKGMADGLSLSLVRAGFRVSKYLAFGPIARVVPYLIRRAEENRGVVRNTAVDRLHLRLGMLSLVNNISVFVFVICYITILNAC